MCEKVAYDKYNDLTTTTHPVMLKLKSQKREVDKFRDEMLEYIALRELSHKAFMCWLCWFDDNRTNFYIEYYKPKAE